MAGVALSLLAVGMLAGCGDDAVRVHRFGVTPAGHESCPALLESLPSKVSDQDERRTTGSTFAAAYGDPAIVIRCGVGKPKDFDKFSSCQRANGIDWFVEDLEAVVNDQSRDVTMTTVGRSPAVEVRLPARYRPPTAAMVDLEKAVKAHTKPNGQGCLD